MPLDDGIPPMWEPVFVEHSFTDCRGEIPPVFFHIVDGEVLHGRRQLEVAGIVSLKACDKGHRHASAEKRVFAVAF